MDLESSAGNRVAFERYRGAAEEYGKRMSPRMLVDYQYKLGVGLARFGQTGRARTLLTAALELAERHKLNAWYFNVEEALRELNPREVSDLSEAPVVREMEVGLREYAESAVS
jgi:hypothetical protein